MCLTAAVCLIVSTVSTKPSFAQKAGGLRGDYFNGPNFERKILSRTDAQIDFRWDGQSPAPGVNREYFSVRWTGKLFAPTSGIYKFSALVDDGIRVWVGGRKVIDEWRKQDDSKFVGQITLKAGQSYDLRVDYYNDWKGSAIQLYWEPPTKQLAFRSEGRRVIPADYFLAPARRRVPPPAKAPEKADNQPVATARKPVNQPNRPPKRTVEMVAKTSLPPVRKPAQAKATEPVIPPGTTAPEVVSKPSDPLAVTPVQFEQSSYVLSPASAVDLDRLAMALKANPTQRIDVCGHTDNVGDPRLNLALSEYRAKVVATYLHRQGIAEERINTKGYGGSYPVADNAVATERIKNRRVEIVIR